MVAACANEPALRVTKSIVTDPLLGGGNVQKITASAEDAVTFAIVVENTSDTTITNVDIVDTFHAAFTDVTWSRTGPNVGAPTTGSGDISLANQTLDAGEKITWLVETVFDPAACVAQVDNIVSVTTADTPGCCDEHVLYAHAQVRNADGPRVKLDPAQGWTSMEALYYLLEAVSLPDAVALADLVNNECGSFADMIGGAGAGDGVAEQLNDAFGDPIANAFVETTAGS